MAGPLGGLFPGLTRSPTKLKYLFTGALVAMYVSYLVALKYVPRLRARWAIGAVLAVHASFFLAPPLALTDVFNYVNYGRMEVVHHLNPYTTIPILEPHGDPSYYLSNWHQLLSPYGPLFTLMTFALVPLGVAGVVLGDQGDPRRGQPRHDLPRVEVRAPAGPRPDRGDRARGAEPDRAGVGAGRRPQRLPDGVLHHARLLPAAALAWVRAIGGAAGVDGEGRARQRSIHRWACRRHRAGWRERRARVAVAARAAWRSARAWRS